MANIKSINGNPIVLDSSGIADDSIADAKLDQNGVALSGAAGAGVMAEIDITENAGYISSTGAWTAQNATNKEVYTQRIPCKAGDRFLFRIAYSEARSLWMNYCLYDSDNTFRSRNGALSATVQSASYSLEIPSDLGYEVGYVVFTYRTFGDSTTDISHFERGLPDKVSANASGLHAVELESSRTMAEAIDGRPAMRFEPGSIQNANGKDYAGQYWRIRSRVTRLPYAVTISNADNDNFRVWYFDNGATANSTSDSGWQGSGYGNASVTVEAGRLFRMVATVKGDDQSGTAPVVDPEAVEFSRPYAGIAVSIANRASTSGRSDMRFRLASKLRGVAHQGYKISGTGSYGGSRVSSMRGAALHGFDYAECDVKFSSDGVAVCCHDTTFTDGTSGNTITISQHTLAELKTYSYQGETIATLDEVVATCKEYGIGLYIDHLGYAASNAHWQHMLSCVSRYGMEDDVVWLVSDASMANTYIIPWYPKARVTLVKNTTDASVLTGWVEAISGSDARLGVDLNYAVLSVEDVQAIRAALPRGVSVELWTIDDMDDYEEYMPYVNAITSNSIASADITRE